jgi:transcriptional regulator with XRE-family HTH domain
MANLLKIRELAEVKKITIRKLAKKVGIGESAMHSLIKNGATNTTTLEKIAKVLDVPVGYFFDDEIPAKQIPQVNINIMNIVKNITAIRKEKGINQEVIADALKLDTAVVSNIENGKRELKVSELEIIANVLKEDVLYLITYPERYEKSIKIPEPVEAILQIRLQSDKKDQVLKLIFGDECLDILNNGSHVKTVI